MNKKLTYYCEELKLNLDVEFNKKEGSWAAICHDLRSFGYSKVSKEDAYENLKKDIKFFIKVHKERGTLKQTLRNWNVILPT